MPSTVRTSRPKSTRAAGLTRCCVIVHLSGFSIGTLWNTLWHTMRHAHNLEGSKFVYTLIVSLQVRPVERERFLAAIAANAAASVRDEPGCLRFDVMEDAHQPNRF